MRCGERTNVEFESLFASVSGRGGGSSEGDIQQGLSIIANKVGVEMQIPLPGPLGLVLLCNNTLLERQRIG